MQRVKYLTRNLKVSIKIWELEIVDTDGNVEYRSEQWFNLFKNLITYHVRFSNYEDYSYVIKNA